MKKFSAFYVNRMFITAFTSARHLSLSWSRSISPCQWRIQKFCACVCGGGGGCGEGFQQIQLRTKGRENWVCGRKPPSQGFHSICKWVKPVLGFGCYGCIFPGTGNSAQLCQNFGISGGGINPQTPPSVRHCSMPKDLILLVSFQLFFALTLLVLNKRSNCQLGIFPHEGDTDIQRRPKTVFLYNSKFWRAMINLLPRAPSNCLPFQH
jgi:hypothetical protein